ncbi:CUE domain-containing protein [Blumeria hordei DH14]|uniref:CUE domain-containing protein n=1 Tax=Blumeria graminis f. sp. hordei (strain DH14) TaxID=546991 RepID=N1J8V6_BLUG1|nr:CUE domain-containing protein [Blumeria hordei DH14]
MNPKVLQLPPMVSFPDKDWCHSISNEEWEAYLNSWIFLAEAHLSNSDFQKISTKDSSVKNFIVSYVTQTALLDELFFSKFSEKLGLLRKICFCICYKLLELKTPPQELTSWDFLADASKVFGRMNGKKLVRLITEENHSCYETTLTQLKTLLIEELNTGIRGNLVKLESNLKRSNYLHSVSPEVAQFLMAGSDYADALISCYKIMNPPLRRVILSNMYFCLIGLTRGETPMISALLDQLYLLKEAAEAHLTGPLNANDSLVSELVTATPILRNIKQRIKEKGSGLKRAESILSSLEKFRKSGRNPISQSFTKNKKIIKPQNIMPDDQSIVNDQVDFDQIVLISQIQDLFPDLESDVIAKLLVEYDNNVEVITSHLLENSIPSNPEQLNAIETRIDSQELASSQNATMNYSSYQRSTRRNIYDGDDLDQLAVDSSRLHYGRRNDPRTTEMLLNNRASAPSKATIFNTLAAFNSDDDERDDTYDISDVGGLVESADLGDNLEGSLTRASSSKISPSSTDEILFRAYKANAQLFQRDAATRRGEPRKKLKQQVALTDQVIEGWAIMLPRNPQLLRQLEAGYDKPSNIERIVKEPAWKVKEDCQSLEHRPQNENELNLNSSEAQVRGSRNRSDVSGAPGEKRTDKARRGKEVDKGSRANHNRRDQRAKKMARGGFPG